MNRTHVWMILVGATALMLTVMWLITELTDKLFTGGYLAAGVISGLGLGLLIAGIVEGRGAHREPR